MHVTSVANGEAATNREAVIAVHGLCGHWLWMLPLVNRVRGAGYRTSNWGYRSAKKSIAEHARSLRSSLLEFENDGTVDRFHVIAHSMGCIVTRAALLHDPPSKLGRIVMLCPPNRGSHAARRLRPFFGWLSRTLTEISDEPDSWVNQLPPTIGERTEVGLIVAGGDLVVAPQSTALPGTRDRIVIPGMHSGILFKAQTAQAVLHFLDHGEF